MKPKRILIIIEAIILVLILSFLISTGFKEKTDVVLHDFSVSEDGTKLTFRTFNASSMGYIRGFEDNGGGVKPHYLTFYSTFGGLNNSFGAKNEFELDLDEGDRRCRIPEGKQLDYQDHKPLCQSQCIHRLSL